MKTILAVAAVLGMVACGGPMTEDGAPIEQAADTQPAPVAPVAPPAGQQTAAPVQAVPAFASAWSFTAKDVSGSFTVTQQPDGRDLVSLDGTATVGGVTGTVNGTEVPSNGVFRVYIQIGARQVQVSGRIDATGTAFSGYVNDTAGFPALGSLTQYSEVVTGTSP